MTNTDSINLRYPFMEQFILVCTAYLFTFSIFKQRTTQLIFNLHVSCLFWSIGRRVKSIVFSSAAVAATPAPVSLTGNNQGIFFPTCCIAGVFSMFGLTGPVPVPEGRCLNLARWSDFFFFFLSGGNGQTNRWSKWATEKMANHEETLFTHPLKGKQIMNRHWA